jgi:phenylacetate-CoA ligase
MSIQVTKHRADFLDLNEINSIQREHWQRQAEYVSCQSAFYQKLFEQKKLSGDLAEIADLPFTDKEMLRSDQHQHAPFGSYLAAAPEQIVRMHRTSGTTGTAMNLALTEQDALMTAVIGGRAQAAAGLGPEHRVVHCLNYQLWMGGYTDHAALEATGAMVVPYGVGGTHGLIRVIQELNINAISCTPSYPAVLAQVIAKDFPELSPKDLGLELGLFGGESGLDDPAFRQKLEETWGFKVRNSNYGVTDILCNFAGQSTLSNDLHFVGLDVLYPELIDPDTELSKPWQAGESGELVLTHLCKQAQPLVRFRTNDIIILTGTDKAACGRSAPRFRVIGRSDDMVVVRGINVFPTMIAEVINQMDNLSGEYRIVLGHLPPYDYLPIEIELANEMPDQAGLANHIEQKIKQTVGASAKVTLLAPQSLPRTEGKTRRVIRDF